MDLSVPVSSGGGSLTNAISRVLGCEEHLEGDNKYRCETCAALCDASREARISRLPHVLTFHVNRGQINTVKVDSVSRVLTSQERAPVPVSNVMCMERWCTPGCENSKRNYRLRAFVVHKGLGAASGHYVAYALIPHSNCKDRTETSGWVQFDDGVVSNASPQIINSMLVPLFTMAATPYLLFYEQDD
jgi:ubiquitin C-terminal hydrolase